MRVRIPSILLVASMFGGVSLVHAQAAPPAQHTETVAAPPAEEDDDDVFNLQLGGTLNFGNTRAFQLAAGSHVMVHRDQHLFTLDFTGTFGTAATRDATTRQFGDFNENARNILGKLRYDFFLTPDDALFISLSGRHDPFTGLDFRFQAQAGYMRNFFREGEGGSHRMWGEIGLDITVDDRFPNPLPNPAVMDPSDPTMCNTPTTPPCTLEDIEDQYSARVFIGYDNHMNENWQFRTGLEALFSFVDDPENIRLTSTSEFLLRIDTQLQAGVRFLLLFDNKPVPGNDSIDTTTVLTVVATLL